MRNAHIWVHNKKPSAEGKLFGVALVSNQVARSQVTDEQEKKEKVN